MPSYNPTTPGQNPNNYLGNTTQNRGFFNRLLRNMSNFGMNYDDMIIQNTYSVSAFEDPKQVGSTNMYDIFNKRVISNILNKKSIAYLDRSYEDKRKILRQYSIKEEIKQFLTILCNETIIYNDDNYFCTVKDLPEQFDPVVRQKYSENFMNVYNNLGFNDGVTAWNYFKNFMIDGYISYEIVYDNKQKNIINLQPIDPLTLIVATDPGTSTIIWIQFPDDPQKRRILLDAQVIYIAYSNNNEYAETSYVEGLIRPFNQLKLIEQTRLLYNLNQAAIYKKFTIPTNGLTRQQAEQQIWQLMAEYHDEVTFDEKTGQAYINGSTAIPHSKDFWFPSGTDGTPNMEIMPFSGVDMNEDVMLNWFFKALKRASHIPFTRFDDETGGGNVHSDATEVTREEVRFSLYIKKLRTIFKEIITKPVRLQMILDFPELKDDNLFHSSIKVEFVSNEIFEEWKRLNNLAKRAEIAASLSSNLQGPDGLPYFHIEWIVRNIMKLSDKEIAENNSYKMQSLAPGTAGGGEGGAPTGEGPSGGGGIEPSGGGGIEPTGGEPTGGETPVVQESPGAQPAPPAQETF